MSTRYYVGTSGFHYDHWRGPFYPRELPKRRWLEFYAQHFSTVELNNSFYRLPSEKAFAAWRDGSPPAFLFAVKVSRFITHVKRLREVEEPLRNFLERARLLEDKLGPLLYQLPPGMHRNDEALESFLALLPEGHRHVFEFRHESWLAEGVFDILRRYHAGFCVMDMPGTTCPLLATADWAYIRFHGTQERYGGCYSGEELDGWASRIGQLAQGLDTVYVYFNNDEQAFAVRNALELRERLGAGAIMPRV